jgi:quinol monooxygenase YgiN
MFVVTSHMRVKPENAAEFERITSELAVTTKANEPEVVFYGQTKSRSEPGVYMAVEIYPSEALWKAHAEAPYFRAALPKIAALVDGFDTRQYDTV